MTEIEIYITTDKKNEDWAVIPFDENEDDARWAKLIDETNELAENVL